MTYDSLSQAKIVDAKVTLYSITCATDAIADVTIDVSRNGSDVVSRIVAKRNYFLQDDFTGRLLMLNVSQGKL